MTGNTDPVRLERIKEQRKRYTSLSFLIRLALILGLALTPLILPSFKVMDVMVKIMIFTLVVASYDLVLGYTGMISLAHGMFFGLGAYVLALIAYHSGTPHWYHLILAVGITLIVSMVLALVVCFFSLRVKRLFFAMLTLALAEFVEILAVQWSELTLGEEGISFSLPWIFNMEWSGGAFFGMQLNGRIVVYYLVLAVSVLFFAFLLRLVSSPVGSVLRSIRSNEQRSIALGYKVFRYQVFSTVMGSVIASLGGMLFAMWLCFVNPESVLGIRIMVDILLMVLIGGLGTLYGSFIGAAFIFVSENWMPGLLKIGADMLPSQELIQRLADRWPLYFGILFILVIIFFPKGVIGTARDIMKRRKSFDYG